MQSFAARHLNPYAPALAAGVAFVLYASFATLMWRIHYSPSWDLGIFTQMLSQYAQGAAPIVDIKGPGFNLWGDHFHPILILLTPLFWIFPYGLTLMLAQAALFAASVWPVASLAFERLTVRGAWLLTASYVLSWGLLNAVHSQFHEIAFGVPLLAFGLVWWIRGKRLPAIVAIGLLVFVKEDLGLTVAVFGLVVWLRDRAELKLALALVAWGVGWMVYAVTLFLPLFNPEGGYDYTENVSLAQTLTDGLTVKIGTMGFLALAAGAIGLRSPYMLLMLPTLAWRFAGNVEGYWDTSFHYSAVLMPIAAVSLVDGAGKTHRTLAPLVAAVAAVALLSQTKVDLFWTSDGYAVDASGAIEEASRYGSVATDVRLLAYLAPHARTYWYGSMEDAVPEAVALRPDDVDSAIEPWAEERFDGDWETVYSGGGYEVVVPAS